MPVRKLNDNQITGVLYFYIHFVTEVICFYTLYSYTGDRPTVWILFLSYDMLAFVPQGIIGYFSDRHPRVPLGAAGLVLLICALMLFKTVDNQFVSLIVLVLGNCMVHVNGAEATLRTAHGRLSGSAIFVSGGSFGVITGRLAEGAGAPLWPLMILGLTALPAAVYVQKYITDQKTPYTEQCRDFRYADPKIAGGIVIAMAVAIVTVRGFMGYGLPTSWNKTTVQTVMLFFFMGTGKALGGISADVLGFRKTALLSTALAAPFLMAGDRHMMISLVGVLLFSMTMAITLGLLVSVLHKTPGLAFGWTTIGLFMGTAPVFFFKFTTLRANNIMISVLTVACFVFLWIIIRKDEWSE